MSSFARTILTLSLFGLLAVGCGEPSGDEAALAASESDLITGRFGGV